MPRDAVPMGSAGLCPPLPTPCSIWGACVTSLLEDRVTLSRLMLRLSPRHLRGHWTVSGDISGPHNWGHPASIRQVGTWGAARTHSALDGWDVSSALGTGEAGSCLEP